jgi:hypothetical protein
MEGAVNRLQEIDVTRNKRAPKRLKNAASKVKAKRQRIKKSDGKKIETIDRSKRAQKVQVELDRDAKSKKRCGREAQDEMEKPDGGRKESASEKAQKRKSKEGERKTSPEWRAHWARWSAQQVQTSAVPQQAGRSCRQMRLMIPATQNWQRNSHSGP